jgi:hypothetical protein
MKHITLFVLISLFAFGNSYSTSFPLTEAPISEGGKWVNGGTTGLDWTNIDTAASSVAYGTITGAGAGYNDSTAVLQGYGPWGSNQSATGVVYISARNNSYYQEVELHLNMTISAHSITGYECTYSLLNDGSQYAGFARWNGPLGNFTSLALVNSGLPVLQNGDMLSCTNNGGTLSLYRNGTLIVSATDTTYTGGSPGIGADLDGTGCSCNIDFGFSSFSAADDVPQPPTSLQTSVQ